MATTNLYTTPYTIYSGTPGAGDWLVDCRCGAINTAVGFLAWTATVNGIVVGGASETRTKDAGKTTAQAIIPIHAATGEAVTITVQSGNASDTAVDTATLTSAIALQTANTIQVGGTAQTARDLGLALPAVAAGAYGGISIVKTKIATTWGIWEATDTWEGGVVPVAGDNIIIKDAITVTVTTDLDLTQFGTLELQGGGALAINTGETVAAIPQHWRVYVCYSPVMANYGEINIAFDSVYYNYGTVVNNYGEMEANYGTVVRNNNGYTIGFNGDGGTVVGNDGTVGQNDGGIVEYNNGTVSKNSSRGIVKHNNGIVGDNSFDGIVLHNHGTVTTNTWESEYDSGSGLVFSDLTSAESQAAAEAAIDDKFDFIGSRVKSVGTDVQGVCGNVFDFAISVLAATGKVLSGGTSQEDEQILDAVKHTVTSTSATVGTQWQLSVNILQPDLSGTIPPIIYASSNEAVATVNSEGFVAYVSNGSCEITATSRATEDSPLQVRRVTITNTSSSAATVATITYTPDAYDPAKHLLVVYNADVADSVTLKNYYLAHRPGVSAANVLGLAGLPDTTSTTSANVTSLILDPIYTWLVANEAAKPIRHIVFMRGVPSRQGAVGSVGMEVYSLLSDRGYRTGSGYQAGSSRFCRAVYQGVTCLPSWVDMGSYAASTAYIDKLAAASSGLNADGVTISGDAAGVGGEEYVLDDKRTSGYLYCPVFADDNAALPSEGVDEANITFNDGTSSLLSEAADVTFLGNWGVHTGVLGDGWGRNGSVALSGNSGWFAMMSVESFNGIYGSAHGDPAEFFAATAFGGTDYANTPVGFVGHTAEPYVSGISSQYYSRLWARGWTFAEAAWAGRNTLHFLAVGDPLVTR
jgi:hypothetical protein